jgi:diadenosine tetraphosphate (Ap4A) HIT family hydrolase
MSWKNPEKWKAMKEGRDCPFCLDGQLEENPHSFKVTELQTSFVRLPKNQYWKGWIIVVLKRHANELFELSNEELAEFWKEVSLVAKAVDEVFAPVKINYAIYGNQCPHLHCHILPQQFENDPYAPIKQNEREVFLPEGEYEQIIHNLQKNL